jgi:chorismate mutase
MSDPLAELRARITANDERIVALVNARLRLVEELWQLKSRVGAPRLDPERERALRAQLEAANAGPLSPEGLAQLVVALLELTKRELGSP